MAAPFRSAYADARPLHVFGVQIRILVPAVAMEGGIGVFETRDEAGAGPPLHVHHDADEVFHVTAGRFRFHCDGRVIEGVPGDTVIVPRGAAHSYLCVESGRITVTMRPGGFEAFFTAVADAGLKVPDDMAAIAELAGRFHLEFLGPNPLAG